MKLRQLRPLALQADGMRKVEKALQHQKQEREWGKHFLMPLGKPSRTLIVVSRTVNTQRPLFTVQKRPWQPSAPLQRELRTGTIANCQRDICPC